jgi:hypothetical protein
MDRKPKARRVARKEPVKDDPIQSDRFIDTARLLGAAETMSVFEKIVDVVSKSKPKDRG